MERWRLRQGRTRSPSRGRVACQATGEAHRRRRMERGQPRNRWRGQRRGRLRVRARWRNGVGERRHRPPAFPTHSVQQPGRLHRVSRTCAGACCVSWCWHRTSLLTPAAFCFCASYLVERHETHNVLEVNADRLLKARAVMPAALRAFAEGRIKNTAESVVARRRRVHNMFKAPSMHVVRGVLLCSTVADLMLTPRPFARVFSRPCRFELIWPPDHGAGASGRRQHFGAGSPSGCVAASRHAIAVAPRCLRRCHRDKGRRHPRRHQCCTASRPRPGRCVGIRTWMRGCR